MYRRNLTIYVCIDIAKLNNFVAAVSSEGEILTPLSKFTNNADGFQLLISKSESYRLRQRRKTKTDEVDIYVIAKALMMQDSSRFATFYNLDQMDLKALGRFRQKTIRRTHYNALGHYASKLVSVI